MSELAFRIASAEPLAFAASPHVAFAVDVRTEVGETRVESILLRSTVRIETAARAHDADERARLVEIFGPESHWGRGARSLVWAQTTSVVGAFTGSTRVEIHVPVSFDLAAVASKYLRALGGREVPILVQWSGTVFVRDATSGGLVVTQIPWDRESAYALPVATFRQALDSHFPGSAVLSLDRDVFERLDRYRIGHGLGSWDLAIAMLLASAARAEGGTP